MKRSLSFHYLQGCFAEAFGAKLGHQNASAGGLQACGVFLQTEDAHFAVFAPECLQPFKSLLS